MFRWSSVRSPGPQVPNMHAPPENAKNSCTACANGIPFCRSSMKSVLACDPDAIVCSSFSKFFGMTGWRLGWMVVPECALALVFAVCVAAGLDGIHHKLYPTKASDRSFSESDQKAMNIGNLPENLYDALVHFENSTWIQSILGKKFCEEYAAAKKEEWLNYMRQVSEWEISEYLYKI